MAQNDVGIIATKDDLDKLWGALALAIKEWSIKVTAAKLQIDILQDAELTALGYAADNDGLNLLRGAAADLANVAAQVKILCEDQPSWAHRIWGPGFS